MAQQYPSQMNDSGPRPHPYLHEPLLYITGLPPYVTDENIACAFVGCGPFRPKIIRDGSNNPLSGTIEFRYLDRAEKALTILQGRPIPDLSPPIPLILSSYPPTNPPTPLPPPNALPRLVKQLPPDFTDSRLYDLFRPYGALASVSVRTQFGPDTGTVEFWNEEDAIQAEEALHCAEVEGQNIAVQVFQPRRAPEFNVAAPAFVPSTFYQPPYPTQYSPPRQSPYSPVRSPIQPPSSPFIHGPGQQVQLAPTGSGSHSGLIDPCNLFVKNLSPEIDSNALFAHFTKFGQIVSARVMRNDTGESRGFGFVSYHQPEHATAAMSAMNGVTLGSKTIVVRLHEPKQLRQEKLAQRFGQGHNGHPRRNSSGATSPAVSEAGESYSAWNSPRLYPSSNLGSPALSPKPTIQSHFERSSGGAPPDRARRGSGSYYAAALNGSFNVPMNYNSLNALSPVVRKDVLSGELNRRIRALDDSLDDKAIDVLVQDIVTKSLSNVLQIMDGDNKLQERIDAYKAAHHVQQRSHSQPPSEPPSRPISVPASQDSSSSDLNENNPATASAPEHPSTPVSVDRSLLTPPPPAPPSTTFLTESSQASTAPTPQLSQRDRILAAISKLESSHQVELTDLIMSLPKQDRALCIFNSEVLKAKLADAKAVLESAGDDDEEEQQGAKEKKTTAAAPAAAAVPSTPQGKTPAGAGVASPQTPDLSFRGASAAPSPTPATPTFMPVATSSAPAMGKSASTSSTTSQYTVSSLAKLPAAEIVRLLVNNGGAGGVVTGMETKADPLVVKSTDEFVDGILSLPVHSQKQALGKQLFKVVKALGLKSPHKVTVALLDQEDLRALAHLMNSYTPVLKEKALAVHF